MVPDRSFLPCRPPANTSTTFNSWETRAPSVWGCRRCMWHPYRQSQAILWPKLSMHIGCAIVWSAGVVHAAAGPGCTTRWSNSAVAWVGARLPLYLRQKRADAVAEAVCGSTSCRGSQRQVCLVGGRGQHACVCRAGCLGCQGLVTRQQWVPSSIHSVKQTEDARQVLPHMTTDLQTTQQRRCVPVYGSIDIRAVPASDGCQLPQSRRNLRMVFERLLCIRACSISVQLYPRTSQLSQLNSPPSLMLHVSTHKHCLWSYAALAWCSKAVLDSCIVREVVLSDASV